MPLNRSQIAILNAIFSFNVETGESPTYQEIADLVELRSASAVGYHIVKLEERGYVARRLRRRRAVMIMPEGRLALESPANSDVGAATPLCVAVVPEPQISEETVTTKLLQ